MAAPSAQRQRVCEYQAKVPIHSRRRRRRQEVPAWHNGPNTCGEERLQGADTPAASSLARRHALGQSTRRRITSPRLLTVSAQHVPPQSPRARSGRHTTPEAPAGSPGAESGRAEGSQGPKSTRAGGRAQKLNRKARIRDVAIVRTLKCFLSRETKRAFARRPELLEPAATRKYLKIPPVLVHLPTYLNALLASFRIHETRSGPPGATVNRSWLEADDN